MPQIQDRSQAELRLHSRLSLSHALLLEAIAVQLYERNESAYHSTHRIRYWSEVSAQKKERWRREALRRLRTGQIAGWTSEVINPYYNSL